MKKSYLLLIYSMIFMGCQGTKNNMMVGGSCSYKNYINSIKITSIKENNSTEECKKSIKIRYQIIKKAENLPVTPRKIAIYKVSKKYLIDKGFNIGSVHNMQISIIKSGTCTPVIEKIIGIDEFAFQKKCKEDNN